ncbi:polysaccharide biosynthesis tyrosine autokinase [Acidipropionibacterium thoenii]|uniref:polysaccharide biosynthesis tyrosine autokinase n=1 Tax=Acidipropionibacterium thoenii TaxID=1751 RepID=UPI0013772FBB|nr:polysaccharide biosynthesis tyrosine autokinase [Acidipropionibacterium thoenii]
MTPDPSSWTLARIRHALRRRWSLVLILMVIGGLGSYGASALLAPTYRSTSTLAFSVNGGSTAADLANGSMFAQDQMQTFAQITTSSAVLQPVIDELRLDMTVKDLSDAIVVTVPLKTLVLQIDVESSSPTRAADLANAIARNLTKVVGTVSSSSEAKNSPSIEATLVDTAVPPRFQSSPDKSLNGMLGAFAGLIIGIAVVLLGAIFDTRMTDPEQLRSVVDRPILGTVPRVKSITEQTATSDPGCLAAEQFRRIHAALIHQTAQRPATDQDHFRLLVTSPGSGDGKTTVAANLALTAAGLGRRVLLIDANLRRPQLASGLGLAESEGLIGVLNGRAGLEGAIRHDDASGLDILPAGGIATDPAELLTSESMRTLLAALTPRYHLVILDTPSTLGVADADLLAPLADGTVVVVNADRTRRGTLLEALSSLDSAGNTVLGLVLNQCRLGRQAGAALDAAVKAPTTASRRSRAAS